MTSVGSQISQMPANKLYINVANVTGGIVDVNNSPVAWMTGAVSTLCATPGHAVFRDMGKNVYLPSPNVPTVSGAQSTILRKVQLVKAPVGGTAQDNATASYYTGYIRLGGQTYGGGDAVPTGVARLN